jgi:hypothetical protein
MSWLVKFKMGILALGLASDASAQTLGTGPKAFDQFRSYYARPDIGTVPSLLAELDRSGAGDWTARPPIIGFIAGLLITNPGQTDLLPRNASLSLRRDYALALSLAGMRGRGLKAAQQGGLDAQQQALIRSAPALSRLTIRNGTELDYSWGAAFATGDARYVRPIVRRFVQLTSRRQKADDILAGATFMRTGQGDMQSLKERYDAQSIQEVALGSAILIALAEQSARHTFIRDGIAAELPAGTQAQRILTAFQGHRL